MAVQLSNALNVCRYRRVTSPLIVNWKRLHRRVLKQLKWSEVLVYRVWRNEFLRKGGNRQRFRIVLDEFPAGIPPRGPSGFIVISLTIIKMEGQGHWSWDTGVIFWRFRNQRIYFVFCWCKKIEGRLYSVGTFSGFRFCREIFGPGLYGRKFGNRFPSLEFYGNSDKSNEALYALHSALSLQMGAWIRFPQSTTFNSI